MLRNRTPLRGLDRRTRRQSFAALLVPLAALALAACEPKGSSAPVSATYTRSDPGSSGPSEQAGGSKQLPSAQAIALLENSLRSNSGDFATLTILGQLRARQGRESGVLEHYLLAEDAFRKALRLKPDYQTAQVYLSSVLLSQQRYAEAEELSRQVAAAQPERIEASAILTDIYLDTGRYPDAEIMLATMFEQTADPAVLARMARYETLRGRDSVALQLLEQACAQAEDSGAPQDEVAWYYTRLGEIRTRSGDYAAAEASLSKAQSIFADYHLALTAMAELRTAQGREKEAIALLERELRIRPAPPLYFTLGELYGRADLSEDAERMFTKGIAMVKGEALNEQIYRRDLIRFYADHGRDLDEALALARADLVARKDVYAYDLLAWTLHRKGLHAEAAVALDSALRMGSRDPELMLHAGSIRLAQGRRKEGRELLERVVARVPGSLLAERAERALSEKPAERADAAETKGKAASELGKEKEVGRAGPESEST